MVATYDLDYVLIVKFFAGLASGSALRSLADQLTVYGRGVDDLVEADEQESRLPTTEKNLAILRRCATTEAGHAVGVLVVRF